MNKKIQITIKQIIGSLNASNLIYGIARNYEKFPNFDSDIDLISKEKIETFKKILKKITKAKKWEYLLYNNLKSKNFLENSKIDTFYFIDFKKLNFIEIDIFKCLLILGTSYYTVDDKSSLEKIKNKFFIIPKKVTKTYNIFQIAKIYKGKKDKKIKKYKKNFLSLGNETYLKKVFFEKKIISLLKKCLKKNEFYKLIFFAQLYKILIFVKYYITNLHKIFFIPYRLVELIFIYFLKPTGFEIKLYYKDNKDLKTSETYLNKLKKKKIINDWKYYDQLPFLIRRIFLERRNIVVKKIRNKKIHENIEKTFKRHFLKKYIKVI